MDTTHKNSVDTSHPNVKFYSAAQSISVFIYKASLLLLKGQVARFVLLLLEWDLGFNCIVEDS